jgi:hypothetical protein
MLQEGGRYGSGLFSSSRSLVQVIPLEPSDIDSGLRRDQRICEPFMLDWNRDWQLVPKGSWW